MRKKVLLFLSLVLATPLFAREHKIFPGTLDSVPAENRRAEAAGLKQYVTMREVDADTERGILIPFTVPVAKSLPRERRVALKTTVVFVEKLDREFYEMTGEHLVVDSAVRPAALQKRLSRFNRSAAPAYGAGASSHERGTTVDFSRRMRKSHYRWLLTRLAYYKARGEVLVIEESRCVHVFVGRDK